MIHINTLQHTRLEELEAKTNRSPEEEAVMVALVALDKKIKANAPQAEIDTAEKAVVDAETAVTA